MLLSFILNITVILFTWAVAFPIGVYAATHQYSWGDHGLTLLGYVIATSIYLLALMAYFHPGKWTMNILTAVLFCIGSYLMFTKLLGVTLARGLLPF